MLQKALFLPTIKFEEIFNKILQAVAKFNLAIYLGLLQHSTVPFLMTFHSLWGYQVFYFTTLYFKLS
jgi:hypothetical protein